VIGEISFSVNNGNVGQDLRDVRLIDFSLHDNFIEDEMEPLNIGQNLTPLSANWQVNAEEIALYIFCILPK
jgi:hypothetical protein